MKFNRDKDIQKLFTSQEVSTNKVLHDIYKTLSIKITDSIVKNASDLGLFNMFAHNWDAKSPLTLFVDFSKGREKNKCLIGKGVLYDSGGYNLKKDPSDMHQDRFGALSALVIAQRLKLPVKVFLVLNLIHDNSVLPGTVISSTLGKNVRVIDTDAEGRVGLAQLIEDLPQYKNLISLATLTGHSCYSIGTGHAEVFSKDNNFLAKVTQMERKVVAPGRYFDDYRAKITKKKPLENLNKSYSEAGAAKAFAFLNEFLVKDQTLTHFDTASIMEKQHKDYTYGLDEISEIIKVIK